MAEVIEAVARLGETLLDVRYVTDGRYAIAGHAFDIAGIPTGAATVMRLGLVEVAMRRVEPPRRFVLRPPLGDRRAIRYLAGSLGVHLVLLWSLAAVDEPELRVELVDGARVISVLDRSSIDRVGESPDNATTGGGNLHAMRAAGRDRPHGHVRTHDEPPAITRAQAIEQAREAGILGSVALRSQGFHTVIGTADLSGGFDAPLYGDLVGESFGAFAVDRMGQGGGCAGGCGNIIAGRSDWIGSGNASGAGWAGGVGTGGLRPHVAQLPTVRLCAGPKPCVVGVGGLDKAIIRRYIRRSLPAFTYCYEKELIATPGLDGTVDTEFLIATDGKVQSVTANGVNEAVASCVAGVIRGIEFPRSHDGNTQVRYPLGYRRAGD